MAWTLVDTPGQVYWTSGTSNSVNYASSGDLMVVGQQQDVSGADIVTSMTYNGVALSRILTSSFDGGGERDYLYYLLNPASGTNPLVVNTSSAMSGDLIVATWTGAKQSGQPDASNIAVGAGVVTLNVSLTTIASNSLIVGIYSDNAGRVSAPGASAQLVKSGRAVGATFQSGLYASNPYDSGAAGLHTFTGNDSGGGVNNVWVVASFAPATGGGATALPFRSLMGVGI